MAAGDNLLHQPPPSTSTRIAPDLLADGRCTSSWKCFLCYISLNHAAHTLSLVKSNRSFTQPACLQTIRQGEFQQDTPIIAMTANASDKDRDECLDAGMDGFLSKPVLKDRLSEAILSVISGRRQFSDKNTVAIKALERF